jgi:hypothetical protein
MIPALMTSRNNPNVKTVMGNVRKIKIGFTKTFNKISTNETTIAIDILVTCTPGISAAIKKILNAEVIICTRKRIIIMGYGLRIKCCELRLIS